MILVFLIYRSSGDFLSSFQSMGLSFQEKKFKIDFQNGNYGGHLGFPIRMILAMRPWRPSRISAQNNFNNVLSTSHTDASYQVLNQLAFWFAKILALFDLHVSPMLPTKFQVRAQLLKASLV